MAGEYVEIPSEILSFTNPTRLFIILNTSKKFWPGIQTHEVYIYIDHEHNLIKAKAPRAYYLREFAGKFQNSRSQQVIEALLQSDNFSVTTNDLMSRTAFEEEKLINVLNHLVRIKAVIYDPEKGNVVELNCSYFR